LNTATIEDPHGLGADEFDISEKAPCVFLRLVQICRMMDHAAYDFRFSLPRTPADEVDDIDCGLGNTPGYDLYRPVPMATRGNDLRAYRRAPAKTFLLKDVISLDVVVITKPQPCSTALDIGLGGQYNSSNLRGAENRPIKPANRQD